MNQLYSLAAQKIFVSLCLKRVLVLSLILDFSGYSPERINPGDQVHTFKSITKIVSASNEKTLDILDKLYGSVVLAGT